MDEGSSFEFQRSLVVRGFCFGVEKCPGFGYMRTIDSGSGLGVRDGVGVGGKAVKSWFFCCIRSILILGS